MTIEQIEKEPEVQVTEEVEQEIISKAELQLEELINAGFILVQWIGSTSIMKVAPSPHQAILAFGARNYGSVIPKEWMMIHKDDFDPRFYRKPTKKEKPDKSKVQLSISGRHGQIIRVKW